MKLKSITTLTFLLLAILTLHAQVPEISPLDLKEKLKSGNENVVVLDVRTQDEINRGVISPGVTTFNYYEGDFKNNIAQLDKDKTYYVYCHVGGRSGKAVQMMQEMGFENVYNVEGGIVKWQQDGMKLVPKQ